MCLPWLSVEFSKDVAEMVERTLFERLIDQGRPSMRGKYVITSSNCQSVAFVARVGKKRVVVVNEQEGKPCDEIVEHSPVFSPDGGRWPFLVELYDSIPGPRWILFSLLPALLESGLFGEASPRWL